MLKAAIPSVVLYAPYTHNPTRFQHDYPKMKTKIVLRNIYYSPQIKSSISLGVPNWEVGADTKLDPDSALGNSLCGCKPNLENPLFS